MKSNLFFLASLALAALVGIFLGVDPDNPRVAGYDIVFWSIIGIGLIPAVIQFVREECRDIRAWLARLRQSNTKSNVTEQFVDIRSNAT